MAPAEKLVLKSLLQESRRWTTLRLETALSRQGLTNALDSLERRRLIESKEDGKYVTYSIDPEKAEEIEEELSDEPFFSDRYLMVRRTVEDVLKKETDVYVQYLMLRCLFDDWSNASLDWVDEMLTLAALALLNKQWDTYRELRNAAERTFTRLNTVVFDLVRKYPIVAAAYIDASTSRQEEGGGGGSWISELVDECYYDYERGFLPGESSLRSEMIEMAAKPFFQHDVPTVAELASYAKKIRRQDHRKGNPQFDFKSEKQIRKLLSVVGDEDRTH